MLLDRAMAAGWLDRADDRSVHLYPAARKPLATLGVNLDDVTR